jgi:hypothetical protein
MYDWFVFYKTCIYSSDGYKYLHTSNANMSEHVGLMSQNCEILKLNPFTTKVGISLNQMMEMYICLMHCKLYSVSIG